MVSVQMEGTVPIDERQLWHLLGLHLDEPTIRAIHTWIRSGRVVREEGEMWFADLTYPEVRVVDREIRLAGRSLRTTWTYRIRPPERFDYELRGSDGSVFTFENAYRPASGGMTVTTKADISLRGVPSFLAGWIVRRILARADREDLEYLARLRARPKGT